MKRLLIDCVLADDRRVEEGQRRRRHLDFPRRRWPELREGFVAGFRE